MTTLEKVRAVIDAAKQLSLHTPIHDRPVMQPGETYCLNARAVYDAVWDLADDWEMVLERVAHPLIVATIPHTEVTPERMAELRKLFEEGQYGAIVPAPETEVLTVAAWRVVCADGSQHYHRKDSLDYDREEIESVLEAFDEVNSCGPHRAEPLYTKGGTDAE